MHPWRKGWPPALSSPVATQELVSQMGSTDEHVIIGILVPTDPQMFWAVLAHACTLVGLSVGCADRPNIFPTEVLFQQRDVEKNRRRIIMYYARPPGHQPPSRRGARIPARPDTGTSVAPGFHTHLLTPVTRNPHPPDRPQFRMASMRPGAGGCVRRRVCLQTPPAPGDACLPYIMNLWGRHVWLQEHGSAGGGNPGATDVPVAW